MSSQVTGPAQQLSKAVADPLKYVHDLVLRFVNGLAGRPVAASELVEIEQVMEIVPLDSHEFGLALNRLGNAKRYMNSGECGAAQYELRLLLGVLSPRRVAEPNRSIRNDRHR